MKRRRTSRAVVQPPHDAISRETPADPADDAPRRVATALAELWDRFKEKTFARIAVIEQAVTAALDGALSDVLRLKAAREAHNLAGSVGMFGFGNASRVAREIEHTLAARVPLGRAHVLRLSELHVALRHELDRAPAGRLHLGGSSGHHHPLVLIVEDDADLADGLVVEGALRGLRTVLATDPETARAFVAQERPDLVLLGLMGSAHRSRALALLADLAGGTPPIPVLVLSGTEELVDRVEVARLGGRGFLVKSLPPSQMVEAADHVLRRLRADRMTVIAVDDDPDVLAVLRTELESRGIGVITLDDPRRFWQAMEAAPPDLLLLDVAMPRFDGLDLCRVVRADPRWSALPLLFLTAHTDPETERAAFAAGADDLIPKPISGPALVDRITQRLERVQIIRSVSETDPCTGLANRRKTESALDQLLRLADRHRQPLCLTRINVDHLAAVNARYGHAAGDAVLRSLGALLQRAFRGEDIVGRWRGDELVLGMYGLTRDDGVHRVAEVLERFRQETFVGAAGTKFMATFSGGVGEYPEDGHDLQGLLLAAGQALRMAKTSGRDRVRPAGWHPGWGPAQTVDVVLVDDDEVLARLILYALETRGYCAQWVRDGEAAAKALTGHHPALRARTILLDVGLPGLDGFSLLGWLSRDGILRRTRVIMLTVRSVEAEVLRALETGAFDHVAKPFSMPVLMHRIRRAMELTGA
jgi:diguanylate cyclase (GGDEF)-like protein